MWQDDYLTISLSNKPDSEIWYHVGFKDDTFNKEEQVAILGICQVYVRSMEPELKSSSQITAERYLILMCVGLVKTILLRRKLKSWSEL